MNIEESKKEIIDVIEDLRLKHNEFLDNYIERIKEIETDEEYSKILADLSEAFGPVFEKRLK